MTLPELAETLRDMAEHVTCLNKELCLPRQDCTLQEAMQRLRVALGDEAYISIEMKINSHRARDVAYVEWSVWDGKTSREARNLAEVVNATLAAHQPEKRETIEQAQAQLDSATEFDPDLAKVLVESGRMAVPCDRRKGMD